ncbi:hypothetical protein ACCAA_910021 [Candidatus Accumulibacter aalborgensis]|uniref:Uncharacterized protein n=1 Tax=Candidatus Accumulibacter aalborgensis TaxID=1860102 RepID=A0A1A8XZ17_9PROT|nr:hypothetical protein ACCAA_910021 [Candidatus Accumulibacter aalborgensis]
MLLRTASKNMVSLTHWNIEATTKKANLRSPFSSGVMDETLASGSGLTGRHFSRLALPKTLQNPSRSLWWVLTGSNRRHPACKASALPTELSTRGVTEAWRT